MSAPILRSAAQTIKTVPTAGAIDSAAAARTAITSTGRSSITASITQQGAASSRAITTSSSTSSSVVLDRTIAETLKDTTRIIDQTASEGLEKVMELAENAMKRANDGAQEKTVETTEMHTTITSASSSATNTLPPNGIAAKIHSEAASAFEQLGDVTQKPTGEGELGILASIEKLTPDFSSSR
ncbi:hypothetical protein ABW20_dc0104023 [Dactylellina cionopaga]|nr:hypothetical protein ABW20_dc0104023 [Dactylellina cionopaga]